MSLRVSPYGGTTAIMLLPGDLVITDETTPVDPGPYAERLHPAGVAAPAADTMAEPAALPPAPGDGPPSDGTATPDDSGSSPGVRPLGGPAWSGASDGPAGSPGTGTADPDGSAPSGGVTDGGASTLNGHGPGAAASGAGRLYAAPDPAEPPEDLTGPIGAVPPSGYLPHRRAARPGTGRPGETGHAAVSPVPEPEPDGWGGSPDLATPDEATGAAEDPQAPEHGPASPGAAGDEARDAGTAAALDPGAPEAGVPYGAGRQDTAYPTTANGLPRRVRTRRRDVADAQPFAPADPTPERTPTAGAHATAPPDRPKATPGTAWDKPAEDTLRGTAAASGTSTGGTIPRHAPPEDAPATGARGTAWDKPWAESAQNDAATPDAEAGTVPADGTPAAAWDRDAGDGPSAWDTAGLDAASAGTPAADDVPGDVPADGAPAAGARGTAWDVPGDATGAGVEGASEEERPALPRRVRQANLAPQLRTDARAGDLELDLTEDDPGAGRTPEEARAMMTSIQRGWLRGRAQPAGGETAADDTGGAPRDADEPSQQSPGLGRAGWPVDEEES